MSMFGDSSLTYSSCAPILTQKMVGRNNYGLPPGFRFHPTDEELIMHYLRNQAKSSPSHVSIIPEVDIYKFDPWELPDKAGIGENEWYFFTPRDRKYPNGIRPNRAAVSGYWKATGTDKAIYSSSKYVGIKKALVFYKGKPPKGIKTDWIMHEYRLSESRVQPYKQNGSMRLDDWVLCRIYKKKNLGGRNYDQQRVGEFASIAHDDPTIEATTEEPYKFPRTCSQTQVWEFGSIDHNLMSQFVNENHYNFNQETTNDKVGSLVRTSEKCELGQGEQPYCAEDIKFEDNQTVFVNSVYGF